MSQKLCLEFLENLKPEPVRELAIITRAKILETIPEIEESFKWNLPFYSLTKNLFYLNPKKDHLIVGFVDGAKMFDGHRKLQGNQDLVRHYLIYTEADWMKYLLTIYSKPKTSRSLVNNLLKTTTLKTQRSITVPNVLDQSLFSWYSKKT